MKAKRTPDSRLEALVNRMFDKSLQSKNLKQVIGIAIECNRFDVMERAISMSTKISETLNYCLHVSNSNLVTRQARPTTEKQFSRSQKILFNHVSSAKRFSVF